MRSSEGLDYLSLRMMISKASDAARAKHRLGQWSRLFRRGKTVARKGASVTEPVCLVTCLHPTGTQHMTHDYPGHGTPAP
eukprot:2022747-Rhodomonas_salina.3